MPLSARTGRESAGGIILTSLQGTVTIEGALWSVIGTPVTPHGPGPHAGPVMQEGSSTVTINGIPVCRLGDKATCGHPATGGGRVSCG